MVSLAVFLLVVFVAVSNAVMPCLPPQLEYKGRDTKGRESYNALDFNKKIYGMKRGGFRMIKDFSSPDQAKRYDIAPDRCDVFNIDNVQDPPRCVPDAARMVTSSHGKAWEFQDNDGATLLYDVTNPSTIFEKFSPDMKQAVIYFGSQPNITQPDVFNIPSSCKTQA